jgi:hypothetical protein
MSHEDADLVDLLSSSTRAGNALQRLVRNNGSLFPA